uniref:Reverse transcriptase n=1 Tax=Triatoma infestans TaxID=30076 RepID=A0A161MPK4_TRIIF
MGRMLSLKNTPSPLRKNNGMWAITENEKADLFAQYVTQSSKPILTHLILILLIKYSQT